jgi:hypothetical protein
VLVTVAVSCSSDCVGAALVVMVNDSEVAASLTVLVDMDASAAVETGMRWIR